MHLEARAQSRRAILSSGVAGERNASKLFRSTPSSNVRVSGSGERAVIAAAIVIACSCGGYGT